MCFIGEAAEATDLSLYMGLKNLTLLVFHLVAGTDAVPIVASRLFYPDGPRSPGGPDTLRRRSYSAVHSCCEKRVFCQSSFPTILKLSEVPLEVGLVLVFGVEFEPEVAALEPVTEGSLTRELPVVGLPRGVPLVEGGSLSLLSGLIPASQLARAALKIDRSSAQLVGQCDASVDAERDLTLARTLRANEVTPLVTLEDLKLTLMISAIKCLMSSVIRLIKACSKYRNS